MNNTERILAKKTKKYFWKTADPKRFIAWLDALALEGYRLDTIGMIGFSFYKDTPQQLAHSVDVLDIKPNDLKDYITTAKSLGLVHITSSPGMHIFAAKNEIAAYDKNSRGQQEFYARCNDLYKKMRIKQTVQLLISAIFALISLILTLIGLINQNNGYASMISVFGAITGFSLVSAYNAYSTLKSVAAYHRVHTERIKRGE